MAKISLNSLGATLAAVFGLRDRKLEATLVAELGHGHAVGVEGVSPAPPTPGQTGAAAGVVAVEALGGEGVV